MWVLNRRQIAYAKYGWKHSLRPSIPYSANIITNDSLTERTREGISLVVFTLFDSSKHRKEFIQLNIAYIGWIADQVQNRYGIDFVKATGMTVEEYVQSKYESFISVRPEDGRLVILEDAGKMIGMGSLTRYNEDIGEIKRMYIKPEYRGKGLGKNLLMNLIDSAKQMEYTALRLDTGGFMDSAQYVYTSVGFRKIPEYAEAEVPIPLRHHWFFMELEL